MFNHDDLNNVSIDSLRKIVHGKQISLEKLTKEIELLRQMLDRKIGETHKHSEVVPNLWNKQEISGVNSDSHRLIKQTISSDDDETSVTELARRFLQQVVDSGGSDIHIQPFLGGGEVRVRSDGILRRLSLLSLPVYEKLCRYLKVQSGMDISNTRTPQDGRITFNVAEHEYDLRLSSLPARGGERIVARILDRNRSFRLGNNGFALTELQTLRQLARQSAGIVLITGPTGSGKSSTLYALLGELNNSERNIITVEEPVEYVLPGLSQIDVNPKAGLTFAAALRSAMRQDPDILLIGEIRDEETAGIAFQAALTGHLVFSTLHTNNALSSLPRLLDLKVKPSILADALIGVVAQRLCRRLCKVCKVPVQEPLRADEAAFKQIVRIAPAYRSGGCNACNNSGYKGRIPIIEILVPSRELREAIASEKLQAWSPGPPELNNLSSLAASACRHIISGDTSVTEVLRVLGSQFWNALAEEYQAVLPATALIQEGTEVAHSPSVLLLGADSSVLEPIGLALEASWFLVLSASSSAQARTLLESHDNIVFVIVDLDSALTDVVLVDYVHKARIDMAWSRLPALLLLPPHRDQLESLLISDGATSPCLIKPIHPMEIVKKVRQALVKNIY